MLDLEDIVTRYAVTDRSVAHLRVNFVASIDGAATHDGVSGPLNDPVDKQVFAALRMLADVVLVAAGTVRDEGYGPLRLAAASVAWRVAHGLPEHPRFAIASARADLDPLSRIFTDAPVRPIVVTHRAPTVPLVPGAPPTAGSAPEEAGRQERLDALRRVADVLECGEGRLDLRGAVTELAARGLPQILSEGGPAFLGALIEADAVDELDLTVAPVLEGGDASRITRGGAQTTRVMRLAHAWPAGDMLFLRYLRAGTTTSATS